MQLLGRNFAKEPGEGIQLENPPGLGLSALTDLRMFRLVEDPGLPSLPIAAVRPPLFGRVTMIGWGRTRSGELTRWNVDDEGNWVEAAPGQGGEFEGFRLGPSSKLWGTNWIDSSQPVESANGDAIGLRAGFVAGQTPQEARAAGGDSGGGVFFKNGSTWELAGIIQSVSTAPDQPGNIAAFGDITNFADLSIYRAQILDIIERANNPERPLWQFATNPLNVNADSAVSPADALAVINELNSPKYSDPLTKQLLPLPPGMTRPPFYYDVNGDGFVSPSDALRVINELNLTNRVVPIQTASDSARNLVTTGVPEPPAWALAVTGSVLLWMLGRRH